MLLLGGEWNFSENVKYLAGNILFQIFYYPLYFYILNIIKYIQLNISYYNFLLSEQERMKVRLAYELLIVNDDHNFLSFFSQALYN